MKKRLFIFLLVLSGWLQSAAQVSWRFQLGATHPLERRFGNTNLGQQALQPGPNLGLFMESAVSEAWSMQYGLLLNARVYATRIAANPVNYSSTTYANFSVGVRRTLSERLSAGLSINPGTLLYFASGSRGSGGYYRFIWERSADFVNSKFDLHLQGTLAYQVHPRLSLHLAYWQGLNNRVSEAFRSIRTPSDPPYQKYWRLLEIGAGWGL